MQQVICQWYCLPKDAVNTKGLGGTKERLDRLMEEKNIGEYQLHRNQT